MVFGRKLLIASDFGSWVFNASFRSGTYESRIVSVRMLCSASARLRFASATATALSGCSSLYLCRMGGTRPLGRKLALGTVKLERQDQATFCVVFASGWLVARFSSSKGVGSSRTASA